MSQCINHDVDPAVLETMRATAVVPLRVLHDAPRDRGESAEQRHARREALWRRRRIEDDRSLALHPPKRRRRPVLWMVELVLEPGRLRRAMIRAFKHGADFLLAHSRGLVTGATARRRWGACVRCTYRRRNAITPGGRRVSYCYGGDQGRSCGCPESTWWPFAMLKWKVRLGAFECPLGKFERTMEIDGSSETVRRAFERRSARNPGKAG